MHKENETMKAYRLGLAAYSKGDFEEASISFRWAAGLDPENPIYCFAAARSALQGGDAEEAERLYLSALKAGRRALGDGHPYMLLVAQELAAFYGEQGRKDEMVSLARRAIGAVDPRAVARAGERAIQALRDLWTMVDEAGSARDLTKF